MRAAQLKGKVPALPAPRPAGSTGHSITSCASHPSIHTTQVSSPGPTISGPRYQCTPATDSQANIRARQVASPQPLRLSNKSLQFRTHAAPLCANSPSPIIPLTRVLPSIVQWPTTPPPPPAAAAAAVPPPPLLRPLPLLFLPLPPTATNGPLAAAPTCLAAALAAAVAPPPGAPLNCCL